MHEKDLRRVALESGKTLSRKAKAKHLSARSSQAGSAVNSPSVSPNHSPGGSRVASRNVSRQGSEDGSDDDDELNSSVASLDLSGFSSWERATPEVWQHELREVSEQIIERSRTKKDTTEAREQMLVVYTNILRAQYSAEELDAQLADLIPALLKCFRSGSAEAESIYALKALSMTVVTTGEELFEETNRAIRSKIQDSSSHKAQAAAIHTLGACAFFGGADMQDTEDIMDFLLDIIETDGDSIEASHNAPIVTAALQEWGLLATMFEDLEGKTERPLEAFENQLDSNDFAVQQAAAENIALIYEQSCTQLEDDEEGKGVYARDEHEHGSFQGQRWKQRYSPFQHDNSAEYSLKAKLSDLSRSTARHIAKDKRKDLHQVAKDVLHTIEHPYRGPRFSTAIDQDSDQYMGHRLTVRFSGKGSGELVIDRWWKYHRFEGVKRIVAGGFVEHYSRNEVVNGSVPRNTLVAPTDF